jgi:hypothetical protein
MYQTEYAVDVYCVKYYALCENEAGWPLLGTSAATGHFG